MKLLVSYPFWLIIISVLCIILERLRPWRTSQRFLRPQLLQDYFWLLFNGVFSSSLLTPILVLIYAGFAKMFFAATGLSPHHVGIIAPYPLAVQIIILIVIADGIEWCVHNLLHRLPWLWRIHRVHHSITTMDWIGNFRFHWGETLIYSAVKYLPLFMLGATWQAVFVVAVVATLIGHLNHANLNISWGPLRYVLNSSRMHIWHHEKHVRGKAGVNFGVVFSFWDWIFGTAYMPKTGADQPVVIGFQGMHKVSGSLIKRFFVPFLD